MMLYLKEANLDDIEKEWRFVRDMPLDENGFTNEWHAVSREAFEAVALPKLLASARGEGLREGYVPETFLFLWNDDEIVGQFRIRHYLTESLRNGAGHIGYCIRKDHRGKGYGTKGLALTLDVARKIIPEDEIYLRVNKDNPASLRVMLRNGGTIRREDESKYHVRIPKAVDCLFCKIASGKVPAMRVYEDDFALAFMDIAGDVDGHLLVIPKAHCKNLLDCDAETLNHVMAAAKKVANHLTDNCGYDGVNLLNASGESAGQSVPHFHIHLIPRKRGDGIDAWPAFSGAKHAVEAVYERIKMP